MDRADGFGLQPLAGGFSGETFLGEAAGERTVVRLYVDRGARRGPAAPEVDAAVLRLVRGLLPVPEVLEIRRADEEHGTPGLLVTSFLPGERLDVVLPDLPDDVRAATGRNLGVVLGRLAQMPMPRAGMFVDGDLTIEPWPPFELSDDLVPGLEAVAEDAQALLDEVDRVCLVHSDVNPNNVLVDAATGAVTGLLDWEFAHAGHPSTDLGNLLRFDREPVFVEAVLDGYLSVAGHLDGLDRPGARQRALDRARAADLVALADLASRAGENPVADRAAARLRAISRSRDLHAQ
ncbi:phosphotransferase family protein [Nocardioides iriomotensis]|uniref:Translation initiation factor IF-2 n=1 Tax=Nocardioides iriomotensis TaxID=715784 RepID=A0A4Q5J394_9ACTN|nr:phosphotransferase [Nocardioides iriomotensis]RYU11911.1 translation initiation factor IF-2 [Nocardioides iriomotensis]